MRLLLTVVLSIAFLVCNAQLGDTLQIVAHRGGVECAPENSLAAVDAAIAMGVDAVEIDVRLTADGKLVVFHDAKVERITNGCGKVSKMTLSEICNLKLKDANGNITPHSPVSLETMLRHVDSRVHLLIEVKSSGKKHVARVVDELIATIERCDAAAWVSVISFSDAVLNALYKRGVPFPLEKLFCCKIPLLPLIIDNGISRFSMKKYHYISTFNIHRSHAGSAIVDRLHDAQKRVRVWTVGAPCGEELHNADGVITDYPGMWIGGSGL